MTVKELKDKIDQLLKNNEDYGDIDVCIPNHKGGMGGTSVTHVKGAYRGMDWDSGKFMIIPEVNMFEKKVRNKFNMEITKEMIDECVEDTRVAGKYVELYERLVDSIKNLYDNEGINRMKGTLKSAGVDCEDMGVSEILYEYSKLI